MLDFPILCTYEYKLEDLLPFAGKENFECLHWRGEEEGRGWREGIRREGEGKRDQERIPLGRCKDRYQNQYRGKTKLSSMRRSGRLGREGKKMENIEKKAFFAPTYRLSFLSYFN